MARAVKLGFVGRAFLPATHECLRHIDVAQTLSLPAPTLLLALYELDLERPVEGLFPQPARLKQVWKPLHLAIVFSTICAAQSFTVRTSGVSGEVQVRYFLTGSFGSYGSFVREADSDGVYRIPLRPDEVYTYDFAKTLKAILWAPSCQIELVSRDLVSDFMREARYECHPLGTITLSGMVTPPPAAAGPHQVELHYVAGWSQGFFGYRDGPLTELVLARADLASNGRFTIDIPDFSKDPVTQDKQSASLRLYVRDSISGSLMATLVPPEDLRASSYMKILPHYESEIRFGVR